MAQFIADRRDVEFVLHEQLQVENLSEHEAYAEFNKKTIDLIIAEARNLAIKEILPTQAEGDREGTKFENGQVTVPESFHKAWELFKEGEWQTALALLLFFTLVVVYLWMRDSAVLNLVGANLGFIIGMTIKRK